MLEQWVVCYLLQRSVHWLAFGRQFILVSQIAGEVPSGGGTQLSPVEVKQPRMFSDYDEITRTLV